MIMELKQKSTEVNKIELDEYFIEQMYRFDDEIRNLISSEIDSVKEFPLTNEEIMKASGVVHLNEKIPTFFTVEFFHASTEYPVLIDVYEISLDDYLDFINSKGLTFKQLKDG